MSTTISPPVLAVPLPGTNGRPEPMNINWSRLKPVINEDTLRSTQGPSTHPGREPLCPICLVDIDADQDSTTHTACMHTFHAHCSGKWADELAVEGRIEKCPMCNGIYVLRDAAKVTVVSWAELLVRVVSHGFWELELTPEERSDYFMRVGEVFNGYGLHPLNRIQIDELIEQRPLGQMNAELDIKYEKIMTVIDSSIKFHVSFLEDLLIAGKSFEAAEPICFDEWANFEMALLTKFQQFQNVANTARDNIMDLEQTHIESAAMYPNGEILHRAVMHARTDNNLHLIRRFDFEILNDALTNQVHIVPYDLGQKRVEEQEDYHRRTGLWAPPDINDPEYFHGWDIPDRFFQDASDDELEEDSQGSLQGDLQFGFRAGSPHDYPIHFQDEIQIDPEDEMQIDPQDDMQIDQQIDQQNDYQNDLQDDDLIE